jgi:hypothetical protein
MPSSDKRRRIEIPTELYERLSAEAAQRGVPVASLATWLLIQSLDLNGPHPTLSQQLDEIAGMVREMHDRMLKQGHAVRGVQDQVAEMREYMELRIPTDQPILRSRHSSDTDEAHGARNRLIEEMRRERGG